MTLDERIEQIANAVAGMRQDEWECIRGAITRDLKEKGENAKVIASKSVCCESASDVRFMLEEQVSRYVNNGWLKKEPTTPEE